MADYKYTYKYFLSWNLTVPSRFSQAEPVQSKLQRLICKGANNEQFLPYAQDFQTSPSENLYLGHSKPLVLLTLLVWSASSKLCSSCVLGAGNFEGHGDHAESPWPSECQKLSHPGFPRDPEVRLLGLLKAQDGFLMVRGGLPSPQNIGWVFLPGDLLVLRYFFQHT